MVVVGDEASFECQASGDPTPELLWRRLSDNSVLPVQQSTGGDNRSTFKVLVQLLKVNTISARFTINEFLGVLR